MKDRIKLVRKQAKLNQTEFGERIGATQAMLTSYETGRVTPSDGTLKLISKEFNVSYAWLKTGEGPMVDPVAEDSTLDQLSELYQNLPDRLRIMLEALIKMTPEWWKVLDDAFEEIERRHEKGGAD